MALERSTRSPSHYYHIHCSPELSRSFLWLRMAIISANTSTVIFDHGITSRYDVKFERHGYRERSNKAGPITRTGCYFQSLRKENARYRFIFRAAPGLLIEYAVCDTTLSFSLWLSKKTKKIPNSDKPKGVYNEKKKSNKSGKKLNEFVSFVQNVMSILLIRYGRRKVRETGQNSFLK